MTSRYFEDWAVGDRFETASLAITRDDIIRFAREFDPQPFHLDDAAGAASVFGSLCASGWHTASIAMKLIVETGAFSGVGLGIEMLRWLSPVRPGDELSVLCTVAATRMTRRPGSGIVTFANVVRTHDREVMTYQAAVLIARRPPIA